MSGPDDQRVRIDGKFFAKAGRRFDFRGVTYGTFAPREDGFQFPDYERIKRDFQAMRAAGFSVVRTYTTPPDDLIDLAADWGLHVLAAAFYPDWRYLLGGGRRDLRRLARAAREEVRTAARRLAGNEQVLGLSIGNEVPADVLRWLGTDTVAGALRDLVDVVREEDPDLLVTYANYPTAEYLPLESLDFVTFNVYLERKDDFHHYLTRLHHLAGERPLVLGELGLDAGPTADGERRQAETLHWQLETAVERGIAGSCVFSWTDEWWVGGSPVEGWHFGLTRADRSPRPALRVAADWNCRTIRDLDVDWPSMSVVICAYNAAATLDECLRHTCALDYPGLEIVVVDDGSTDSTADIARRHPRAILLSIPHGGLSVARNEGFRAASCDIVAYLDSDAFPSPEWPYYLARGFEHAGVGGAGGPNVPPAGDGEGAQVVARAPGGPVHVLLSDDRAEHIPGCNMAFRKHVLVEVDGFDPVYVSAGDDVDLCWKLLDRKWAIAFHPAALVWHHRRSGLRAYLRQQRGYGRSEALVEARHPARFTPAGTARWRGRIYNSLTPSVTHQLVYRGSYGAAAYQSVYQGGGYFLDLVHQAGVPLALLWMLSLPLALVNAWLGLPALLAALAVIGLAGFDMTRADPPRQVRHRLRFRANVAAHNLLQPVVRAWARARSRKEASRMLTLRELPAPVQALPHGVLVLPEVGARAELAASLIEGLRRSGRRTSVPSGWEDHDSRMALSPLVDGDLLTSSHPVGFVQVRIRPRLRIRRVAAALAAAIAAAIVSPILGAVLSAAPLATVGLGLYRSRSLLPRLLDRAVPA